MLLDAQDYDYVICHSSWTTLIFGSLVGNSGAKLIGWLHDVPAGGNWFKNFTGLIERAARFVRPKLVICNSRYTSQFVGELYKEVPHAVVYCPVEPPAVPVSTRKRIRDVFQVPEDTVIIAQVGRMEEWKGHMPHLRALASMREIGNWECWIVGGSQRTREAQYLAGLRNFVDEAGLSKRVRFLGQRDDVPELLASADLLCQPNTAPEPFGMVFVEALGAGLPVVTSAMGGALEIVTESCGVFVKAGDVQQLSNALTSLVTNKDLRRRLSSNGPARAREISSPARSLTELHAVLRDFKNTEAAK